jgi:hypothetical protein
LCCSKEVLPRDVAGNRTAQWQVREIFIEAKKQINNKELFYWH